MQADEFWCRAYLTAMGAGHVSDVRNSLTHEALALYGEQAADAALEVARRRGMVTGERTAGGADVERLKFTAERDGDIWTIHSSGLTHGVQVRAGGERYPIGPIDALCVKWTETMPLKPAEVWIERPAKGGA